MDVIGHALWFGIQVTRWLIVQAFHASCYATKALFEAVLGSLFGGVLLRSRVTVVLTSAVLWGAIGVVLVLLGSGRENILAGIVFGSGWGVFVAAQVLKAWDYEAELDPPVEEERIHMLGQPLAIQDETRPLSPSADLAVDDGDQCDREQGDDRHSGDHPEDDHHDGGAWRWRVAIIMVAVTTAIMALASQ